MSEIKYITLREKKKLKMKLRRGLAVSGVPKEAYLERYGWEFYCMAQGDGEPEMTRLYIHR